MTMKSIAKTVSNQQSRTREINGAQHPVSVATFILGTILFALMIGWHNSLEARIYKCVSANGSISYSGSECPYNEKTAKVMSSKGRGKNATDCAVAESFVRQTAEQMRSGTPSGKVFESFGGISSISSFAVSTINYIYTYAGNLTTTTERVQELTLQSCRAGTFGVPTCSTLPAIFVNDQGGCGTLDSSPAVTATTAAENERERRRATRMRQRQQQASLDGE